jgi:hypothetical protein
MTSGADKTPDQSQADASAGDRPAERRPNRIRRSAEDMLARAETMPWFGIGVGPEDAKKYLEPESLNDGENQATP